MENCRNNTFVGIRLPAFKWKKFVSATALNNESSSDCDTGVLSITEEERDNSISTFYTNICSIEDNNKKSSQRSDSDDVSICKVVINERKQKNKLLSSSKEKLLNKAMKFAQYDDKESLKTLIEEGLSVNASDIYGWSLLMVASFAGSENVVKYLISKGVRKGKRDSKGNTALYLASRNNHTNIVNLLIKKSKNSQAPNGDISNEIAIEISSNTTSAFCEICNLKPSCSMKKHEASISHLFKLGKYHSQPIYGIPRTNVGFQMLLQQGWNDSQGLGPDGTGRKYPVKSVEKKNRHGVGHKIKIINNEGSKKNCRNMEESFKKKTSKNLEKLKEKNLRLLLNEPDRRE